MDRFSTLLLAFIFFIKSGSFIYLLNAVMYFYVGTEHFRWNGTELTDRFAQLITHPDFALSR